jgi:hypothetical protein
MIKKNAIISLCLFISCISLFSMHNNQAEWPRVKERLTPDKIKNLIGAIKNQFDIEPFAEIVVARAQNNNPTFAITRDTNLLTDDECIEELWNLLYYAKRRYPRLSADYIRTYHAMAKLYLSVGAVPPLFQGATENKLLERFINPLLETLAQFPVDSDNPSWTLRYRAQLLIKKATLFMIDREQNLATAYQWLSTLAGQHTTQTNALLAAEIILDHNFTPAGMTRANAEAHARTLINNALQQAAPWENTVQGAPQNDPWKAITPIYIPEVRRYPGPAPVAQPEDNPPSPGAPDDHDNPGNGPDNHGPDAPHDDDNDSDDDNDQDGHDGAVNQEERQLAVYPTTQQWLGIEIPDDATLQVRYREIQRSTMRSDKHISRNILENIIDDTNARRVFYAIENSLLENKIIVAHFGCQPNLFTLFCKANNISAQLIREQQIERLLHALHPLWSFTVNNNIDKQKLVEIALAHKMATIVDNPKPRSLVVLITKEHNGLLSEKQKTEIRQNWSKGATFGELKEQFKPISYQQLFSLVETRNDLFPINIEFHNEVNTIVEQDLQHKELVRSSKTRNAVLSLKVKSTELRNKILAEEGLLADTKTLRKSEWQKLNAKDLSERKKLKRVQEKVQASAPKKRKLN